MKPLLLTFAPLLAWSIISCHSPSEGEADPNQPAETIWSHYGDSIADASDPRSVAEAIEKLNNGEGGMGLYEAEIIQSCLTMGCWMSIKGPQDDTLMVFMKDHAFFVPKDSVQGKKTYFIGEAYFDTLSVEFQKHLLEDAGASQSEIDAVTEPAFELAFEASGVMIADVPAGAPMAGDE